MNLKSGSLANLARIRDCLRPRAGFHDPIHLSCDVDEEECLTASLAHRYVAGGESRGGRS